MNPEIDSTSEKAIDALLSEVVGKHSAPDLSRQILDRLHDDSAVATSVNLHSSFNGVDSSAGSRSKSSSTKSAMTVFLIAAASIAAMVFVGWFIVSEQSDNLPQIALEPEIEKSLSRNPRLAVQDRKRPDAGGSVAPNGEIAENSRARRPLDGISLTIADDSSNDSLLDDMDVRNDRSKYIGEATVSPVTLVARRHQESFQNYWASINVQPTQEIDNKQLANRIGAIVGTSIGPSHVSSAESIESLLSQPRYARPFATALLREMTDGGLDVIDPSDAQRLLDLVAEATSAKQPWDIVLSKLLSGDEKVSAAWYGAVSVRGEHDRALRLAASVVGIDLRCVRCHDSLLTGRTSQAEYWSFVGLLSKSIKPVGDGAKMIQSHSPEDPIVFYETRDGLQKVTTAGVPRRWVSKTTNENDPSVDQSVIKSLKDWSREIRGSTQLAEATVDLVCRLILGRTLRGSVIDVQAMPQTDSLGQLRGELVADVLASNFDLRRLIALVATSPAIRRSVPEALEENRIDYTRPEAIDDAYTQVGVFAASLPQDLKTSVSKRASILRETMGIRVDRSQDTVLAQAVEVAGDDAASRTKSETRSISDKERLRKNLLFTTSGERVDSLPVRWLESIDDLDQQIDHLAYLKGQTGFSKPTQRTVDEMKAMTMPGAEILHRTWWMIR